MKRNEPSQWTWEPQAAKRHEKAYKRGRGSALYRMRNESVKHEVSLRVVWTREECLKRGRRLLNCILTHICTQEVVRPQTRDTWPRLQFIINVSPVKPASMYQSEDFRWPKPKPKANSEFVVNPNRELPLSGLVHNGNLCLLHATRVAVCKPLNLNVGPEERPGTNALPAEGWGGLTS